MYMMLLCMCVYVYVCVYVCVVWKELERAQAKVALLEKDLALEVHRREQVKGGTLLVLWLESRYNTSLISHFL